MTILWSWNTPLICSPFLAARPITGDDILSSFQTSITTLGRTNLTLSSSSRSICSAAVSKLWMILQTEVVYMISMHGTHFKLTSLLLFVGLVNVLTPYYLLLYLCWGFYWIYRPIHSRYNFSIGFISPYILYRTSSLDQTTRYYRCSVFFIREHPFNLKGGGGGGLWVFSESKYFFPLRSAADFFLARHYSFSTKTIIFKAQSAHSIFFSAHFRDSIIFSIKADRNHLPPPPKKPIAHSS